MYLICSSVVLTELLLINFNVKFNPFTMKKHSNLKGLVTVYMFLFSLVCLAQPPVYNNEIPIPPLIDMAGVDTIKLEMAIHQHKFNPSDTSDQALNGTVNQPFGIQSWAYNTPGSNVMTNLGPTLLWHSESPVHIQVINHLNQPTTTHWHGAELPAQYDGGPHQPIGVNDTFFVDIIDKDSTSTMWYHPHYHNNTFPQVLLGLSGMIISKQDNDGIDNVLPHGYGIDDFPIIIGDLKTKPITDLNSGLPIYANDTTKVKRPYNIVNGVTNPSLRVPAHQVRLRILNGSTRKGIKYAITDEYSSGLLIPYTIVATDGGFTMSPDVRLSSIIGPGARTEIVLNLTNYNIGDTLYLRNFSSTMGADVVGAPNTGGQGGDVTQGDAFLMLIVAPDSVGYSYLDSSPNFTASWHSGLQDTLNINRIRLKSLDHAPNNGPGFTINSTTYDMMTINDTICIGAREIWSFKNNTPISHPLHIHKIFFRVIQVDSAGTTFTPQQLIERGFNGPKDDVLIRKDWTVRLLAQFDDFPNAINPMLSYMYHCHILTHEDAEGGGMMHQFVVTGDFACITVGTDELDETKDFALYPNPAGNLLYMRAKSSGKSAVKIIDLQGNVVKNQSFQPFDGEIQIEVDGLTKGLYIVEWTTEQGIFTKKLLLN